MPRLFGFAPTTIPGPRVLPLVGAPIELFRFLDDPVGVLLRVRSHGDVVAVIGKSPAFVCVFGEAHNRVVLSAPQVFRHDEDLLRGPPGSGVDYLKNGLVCINGDRHKRHRRLMMPAFQKYALDRYATDVVEASRARLDTWEPGSDRRLDTLCRELSLCVAVKCFYGLDADAGLPSLGKVAADFMDLMTDPLTILAPFDLPGLPHRRSLRLGDELRDGLLALMEEKKRRGGEQRDAMAMLMASRDEDGRSLSDPELVADAAGLFIAGHETSAWTLAWTLFLLDQHPDALDALLAELDAELGGRAPTPEDLPRLRRLDAVVKESMRILPAVPLLFLRVCAETTTLGGHSLPPGANVVVSPLATHHDPAVFPEPRRFLPERWTALTPGPYQYLPFGAGPRNCIGMLFAERSLRMMLTMILQRYRISFADGARVDRHVRGNVLMAKGGMRVTLRKAERVKRTAPRVEGDIVELVERV